MAILIAIILLIVLLVFASYVFFTKRKNNFGNISVQKFLAPPSFTKLKVSKSNVVSTINSSGKNLLEKYSKELNSIAHRVDKIDRVNIITMPSFFNSNEKWPGCLPRPLYQGTCGSCWGFASVTCLSSRFFIESCGNSGCLNYPQVNAGSLNEVLSNLNITYGFKKIFLNIITDTLDNKQPTINQTQWLAKAELNQKQLWDTTIDNNTRHMFAQVLIYMLDFQSLGSVDLHDVNAVKERAKKTFNFWSKFTGGANLLTPSIDIHKLEESWKNQPLNLSAEKLIACCTDCMKLDFQRAIDIKTKINNPLCSGGSLSDAWILLRDTGTTDSLCIGYNLDNYKPGDKLYTCSEIQGPYYSFCSGYVLNKENPEKLDTNIKDFENSGLLPIAIPNEYSSMGEIPWIDPQLFRFRAKNAYTIRNDILEIQREIIERGPVNSGFVVYNDFEQSFGGTGMGGQFYDGSNPLGSDSNCLIYMNDPRIKQDSVGGHAITIVGWGNFQYTKNGVVYNIPYWTCLNSWGVEWGHNGFPEYHSRNGQPKNLNGGGYFWIVRGINNCGIEENVTCGQPDIQNMSYPGVIDKYGWGIDPPSDTNNSIKFLPGLNTKDITVKGSKLEILPSLEGGGTFTDVIPAHYNKSTGTGTWQIKSMTPPSPYLMFWPSSRPTYCIGNTLNVLDDKITDNIIQVSPKTINLIKELLPMAKNPLLLLDSEINQEQIQLIQITKSGLKVNRGVNYNQLSKHNKNATLKVFPYQNISIDFLDKHGFTTC